MLTDLSQLLQPYLIRRKRLRIRFPTTKYPYVFQIIYFICSSLFFYSFSQWQSVSSCTAVAINRYRTPRLKKILVFGKCAVTPHRLYRDSLTLTVTLRSPIPKRSQDPHKHLRWRALQ